MFYTAIHNLMGLLNAVKDETNQLCAVSSACYNGLNYIRYTNNIMHDMKHFKVKNSLKFFINKQHCQDIKYLTRVEGEPGEPSQKVDYKLSINILKISFKVQV